MHESSYIRSCPMFTPVAPRSLASLHTCRTQSSHPPVLVRSELARPFLEKKERRTTPSVHMGPPAKPARPSNLTRPLAPANATLSSSLPQHPHQHQSNIRISERGYLGAGMGTRMEPPEAGLRGRPTPDSAQVSRNGWMRTFREGANGGCVRLGCRCTRSIPRFFLFATEGKGTGR